MITKTFQDIVINPLTGQILYVKGDMITKLALLRLTGVGIIPECIGVNPNLDYPAYSPGSDVAPSLFKYDPDDDLSWLNELDLLELI